jgi:hypothetical protein
MNLGKDIVDAFVRYFVEVQGARLAFWLKPPVSPNVEFVNGPLTALAFLMARYFFDEIPNAATYGSLIIAFVIVTTLLAGVACLVIPPARQALGENMRKFLSTVWVLSTMAALISVLDSLLHATDSSLAVALQNAGWDAIDPDVVATCIPSVIIASIIVGLLESLSGGGRATKGEYALAVILLFLAATVGLGLMIGAGRES